jgi:phage terminase large subunit
MPQVDFTWYQPVNEIQRQFHVSNARHRLLIGGYGGGKTFPAMIEAFRHMWDNPRHEFLVARNTWDSLEQNIESEMLEVAEMTKSIKKWDKTKHDLYLWNDHKCMFRPLSLSRAQLKGMHLCGFLLDDPDEQEYWGVITFLYSRLRDKFVKAKAYRTIVTANWEGYHGLWRTFMKDKNPGEFSPEDPYAYWMVRTDDNPTLQPDYVKDLSRIHSEAWMDRYVYMQNLDRYSGLVYPEFGRHNFEDLSWIKDREKSKDMMKIMVVDNGLGVTAVVKMACDWRHIYIYDEWYKQGIVSSELGEYLRGEMMADNYRAVVIDPASARGDQTSGTSVKADLWDKYRIRTEGAVNDRTTGIQIVRDFLKPADEKEPPVIQFDARSCPNARAEFRKYRRKMPRDFDEDSFDYSDDVVKKHDHTMDCIRYGCCYFRRFITKVGRIQDMIKRERKELWKARLEKMKLYQENPRLRRAHKLQDIYRRNGYKLQGQKVVRINSEQRIEA